MNTDQVLKAVKAATPYTVNVAAADVDPAMIVQYVPQLGTGGTAATCEVTSGTDLQFLVDTAAPAGDDAIGVAGAITEATYTTLGAMADAINGTKAWRARLVGALRADSSDTKLLTAGPTSCIGDQGLPIYHDSSATGFVSLAVTGERFVTNGPNGHFSDDGNARCNDKCINKIMSMSLNLNITGTWSWQYHFEKQIGTTVQAGQSITGLTDATAYTYGDANHASPYLEAPLGYRIVVRLTGTTVTAATCNILGKSAYVNGSHMVLTRGY